MALLSFRELDELIYDWFGGATDVTKGHISTIFNNAALYFGDLTPYQNPTSGRHFPAVVVEQVYEYASRDRFTSYVEVVEDEDVTTQTVSTGPIPYDVYYNIHFLTRNKNDLRSLKTKFAARIEPFGEIGDEDANSYYEILSKISVPNEMYGDQVVYHDVVEMVFHVEVATELTKTYNKVLEATVVFDDRTFTITDSDIEVN